MLSAAPRGLLFSPFIPSRWSSQLTVIPDHFFSPHYPLAATDASFPATYLAPPVKPSSVIIARPSSPTLLKSTYFPLTPQSSKACLALSPSPVTISSHALLFPNLLNTNRVNDEMKQLRNRKGKSFSFTSSFFFPLLFLREKSKHSLKDLIWLKLHWRGQSVPAQKVVGRESKQKQIVYLLL